MFPRRTAVSMCSTSIAFSVEPQKAIPLWLEGAPGALGNRPDDLLFWLGERGMLKK